MSFEQWYGNWKAVVAYVVVFAVFTGGFARPRRSGEWRGMGLFQAFLVALFTEMFGVPLTIYLLAPALGLPPKAFGFYESHLWGYLLARTGLVPVDLAAHLMMLLSNLLIAPGIILVIAGWRRIYRAGDGLVTTGIYAKMRHPQYLGIVMVATGFLIMWPTLPTLIMYPILLLMYGRLAGEEERRLSEEYGDAYERYRQRVPAVLPVFQPRPHESTSVVESWREFRAWAAEFESPLLLALLLWLCALLLVALLVLPFFGSGVAMLVAALLLIVMLVVCLNICRPRVRQRVDEIVNSTVDEVFNRQEGGVRK